MDTISTMPARSSRILPYALTDAVRLCERLRARCGGLLLGEDMSLRFLEHVSVDRPTHVRLRDASELSLPAALQLVSFDEEWCQVRIESRLGIAPVGSLPERVSLLVHNATDVIVGGVLGHYERRVR